MRPMKVGQRFKLTPDAVDNYGSKYANKALTVSHVATKYGPPGGPQGTHPGYDAGMEGEALYDAEGLPFSVYEYEVERL